MYPSDYGYATSGGSTTDRSRCLAYKLYFWDGSANSNCTKNDWLYNSSNAQWMLSPRSGNAYDVFNVDSNGRVVNSWAEYSIVTRRVVYLKSNISVSEGDGTLASPFKLELS